MYFLIENLDMLLLLSLNDDRLTRPFYTMKLLLTDKTKITNWKELLKYLFKTYLNLASFVVHYKQFLFCFSANKLTAIEKWFFHYQRCKYENCNFYSCFPMFLDYYNEGNCLAKDFILLNANNVRWLHLLILNTSQTKNVLFS